MTEQSQGTCAGRAWVFGDNVDTDQIIPAEFLVTGDRAELGSHAFAYARPDFAKNVKEGDIVVAGDNFGCGSSREHAPRALLGAGVCCVIAQSFARIFYRNSINIGLPLIEADVDVNEGDTLEVDFGAGKICERGQEKCAFSPQPDFLKNLIAAGGIVAYTKQKIREGGT